MEIEKETLVDESMEKKEGATPPETPEKRKRGRPRTLRGSVTVKDVVKAVMQTGGHILDTIAVLGLSNGDFYSRFRYNPKVEKALLEARRMGFESVTDVLFTQAMKGDMKAISLYLKYNPIAKENHWVETQTLTFRNEKPLTDDEKKELAKQLFG